VTSPGAMRCFLRQLGEQRLRDEREQVIGIIDARPNAIRRPQGAQQPVPQLQEVRDQRAFGELSGSALIGLGVAPARSAAGSAPVASVGGVRERVGAPEPRSPLAQLRRVVAACALRACSSCTPSTARELPAMARARPTQRPSSRRTGQLLRSSTISAGRR